MKTCIDILIHLANRIKDLKKIKLISFKDYPLIQDRLTMTEAMQVTIQQALQLRNTYSLPFWDAFNVSLFNKEFDNFSFLQQVNFHNSKNEVIEIEAKLIESFLLGLDLKKYLTINSKITLENGDERHMTLLDFHIPVNPTNEKLCIQVLKELKLEGYLLDSGKSYHFYGKVILTESELLRLLAQALLFSPIIDRAWIAHQLIEKSSSLRITNKYSRLPFLVTEI